MRALSPSPHRPADYPPPATTTTCTHLAARPFPLLTSPRYEAKLASERESALRLKGENGIMRKKFTALQKDIEDQKDEINGADLARSPPDLPRVLLTLR